MIETYMLPERENCPDMALELRLAAYRKDTDDWFLHPGLLEMSPKDLLDLMLDRNEECMGVIGDEFKGKVPLVSVKAVRGKKMISAETENELDGFLEWLEKG